MSSAEIKKKLIRKIQSIEDEALLKEVSNLIDSELQEPQPPYKLSNAMNKAVDDAMDQFEKGDFLDHDQANKEMDKWLGG